MKHIMFFLSSILSANVIIAQVSLNEAMQAVGFRKNIGEIKDQDGNTNQEVKYQFSAGDFNLMLKQNSFSYELIKVENHPALPESGTRNFYDEEEAFQKQNPVVSISRIDITLEGANPNPEIVTGDANGTYFNYYVGMKKNAPVVNVQCYNRVMYKDIYPNIDLLFLAGDDDANSALEYEWILHPGADANNIKLIYSGAKGITAKDDGTIDLLTSRGIVTEGKPFSYTYIDGKEVKSEYSLKNNSLSYRLTEYDHSQTLIIDPTLMWATDYGGEMDETIFETEIVVDHLSKVVMSGSTTSTTGIATSGAWDVTYQQFTDIFIVKFNSAGNIQWGTYYGGNGKDGTFSTTVDHANNIIIGGSTTTDSGMATAGAYKSSLSGSQDDILLAKFSAAGNLQWATYYGGNDEEHLRNCLATKSNNIMVCGFTKSNSGIAYGNSIYQSVYGGGGDAVIGEFTKDGWPLWVTYLGGGGEDRTHVTCFDTSQTYFYAAGTTESGSNMIINSPWQKKKGSKVDAYLSYWDTSGHYYWSTYIGGNKDDRARGVLVDGSGKVYVVGFTQSVDSIASPGAHQETWGGGYSNGGIPNDDGYLIKFDHSGHYLFGTYYGGSKEEFVRGADIDSAANIYMAGDAQSFDSIATPNGFMPHKIANTNSDGMFAKWDSAGHLIWGSYLGTETVDEGDDVALYKGHYIYVSINSHGDMPVTPGVYQVKNAGGADVVLYRFETGSDCYDQYEPNEIYKNGHLLNGYSTGLDNVFGWSGTISSATDQDWYRIKPTSAVPNYMVILDSLTQNYGLIGLNKQGNQIGFSNHSGTTPDTVVLNNLIAGKNYIGIVHDAGAYDASSCYRLRVYKSVDPFSLKSASPSGLFRTDLFVFPNPTHDKLNVNLISEKQSPSEILVYDLLSRVVYHSEINLSEGYQQFSIPVSLLENGAYQLVIQNEYKFWQKSFIKQ